jgi:hypothetical protein
MRECTNDPVIGQNVGYQAGFRVEHGFCMYMPASYCSGDGFADFRVYSAWQ